MASARAALLVSCVILLDLCQASFLQVNGNPQVLFFSDSKTLLRPSTEATVSGQASPISPKAVAATSAALLGVPTPPGTNAAVAKEISQVLEPNPLEHGSLVVVLALRSAPLLTEEWLKNAAQGSQWPMQLMQRRELLGLDGTPIHALKKELSLLRQANEGNLRVFPEADWARTPPTKAQDEEAWDASNLNGDMLGSKDGYSVSSIITTFGPMGESFIHDVTQVARLVENSAAAFTDSPALVAASISLADLKSDTPSDVNQALDAAVAVVMDSIVRSKKTQDPVALALVLDANKPGEQHELGLLLPSGDFGFDGRGRSLYDTEGETPHDVEVKTLYIVVWLILLTAIIIGMWLMCAMNVTKDTLLYSGAKID